MCLLLIVYLHFQKEQCIIIFIMISDPENEDEYTDQSKP